ncbi:hypothetical protein [Streptomyces inhibens]|uniref:hypothetical protein n=1 Tax=Streptomyces inhibens TaxID=2293571 RepID=UPI000FFB6C9A|nr:hypothetical protein [Streptomyces inhibens]
MPTAPTPSRTLADATPHSRSARAAPSDTEPLPSEARAFRRQHGDPLGWGSGEWAPYVDLGGVS